MTRKLRPSEIAEYEKAFNLTHEVGAKKHPHSWYLANRKAVGAIRTLSIDPHDPQAKLMASLIILRVLDAVEAP